MSLRRKTPLKRSGPPKRTDAPPKQRNPLRREPSAEQKAKTEKRRRKSNRERWGRDFGPHGAFVRSFPCEACGVHGRSEAHHDPPLSKGGDRRNLVPLCGEHHRTGPDARHRIGKEKFNELFGVDLEARAAFFWSISPHNDDERD